MGIVTRADIVKSLDVEQSLAESIVDYVRDHDLPSGGAKPGAVERDARSIGKLVGDQFERLKVADIMNSTLVTMTAEEPLEVAARLMLEHGIHRLPVTRGERLVGIVSSLDLVRLIADGALVARA